MEMLFYGAPGRIRTADPRITNALLYQLSHGSMFASSGIAAHFFNCSGA